LFTLVSNYIGCYMLLFDSANYADDRLPPETYLRNQREPVPFSLQKA